ncbi:MAG: hypothetical protein HRU43_02020 [Simkaniaceae bacterium]|nr:hypothetical protein [Simkaniaceae bacterium]
MSNTSNTPELPKATGTISQNVLLDALMSMTNFSEELQASQVAFANMGINLGEALQEAYDISKDVLDADADKVGKYTDSGDAGKQTEAQDQYSNDQTYWNNVTSTLNTNNGTVNTTLSNISNEVNSTLQLVSPLTSVMQSLANSISSPNAT